MTSFDELGDRAERMIPWASQLVEAVHDGGISDVARVLGMTEVQGNMRALSVVLAAMVDPNATLKDLLGWVPPLDRPIAHATLFALPSPVDDAADRQRAKAARERPAIVAAPTIRIELDERGWTMPTVRAFTKADARDMDDEPVKVLHAAYRRGDPSRAARFGYLEWEKRRQARSRPPRRGDPARTG